MLTFALMPMIDVWFARLNARSLRRRLKALSGKASGGQVGRKVKKAFQQDHLRSFDTLVEVDDGHPRFISRPLLLVPVEELLSGDQRERYAEVVSEFLRRYRSGLPPDRRALLESYRFTDLARKVVGVGQRRDPCMGRAVHGPRPRRPAPASAEGGAALSPGPLRRGHRRRLAGRACRPGAAD